MKIIALTDLHGRLNILPRFGPVLSSADILLLAGDNTHFGHFKDMQAVIQHIRKYNENILAISGNCDYPDGEQYLGEAGIGINCRMKEFRGLYMAGMSGSLPCPGTTPHEYSEDEFRIHLGALAEDLKHPFILVAHQPPFNTSNDQVSPGTHVGSTAIRTFIEEFSPLVCFTGHIHEGVGIDAIGMTKVINPGPARDGKYASLIIENGMIRDLTIGNV